tara:strand:+ start:476 stop:1369 length:894 start_codon:yes stop_codon:yes gene_type:complete
MTGSPYHIYLNSLAASGRRSMATLLDQSVLLLGHDGPAEHFQWHQLTFEKVNFIRSSLVELGYAVNTINMMLAALRGVTKASFNLGKMEADDMLRINAVKSIKGSTIRSGRRLSQAEMTCLFSTCDNFNHPAKGAREKALLLIGIGAGLRCSEICSLNLIDLDGQQGLLRVMEGKGRKQRQIYLAGSVQTAINAWLQQRGSEPGALFTTIRKGGVITHQRLSSSGLSHAIRALQQQAKIAAFTPHDMRRTFITQLLEDGVDLNTVRQLAGHSDVSTTTRYDKRDVAWQKNASQSIAF